MRVTIRPQLVAWRTLGMMAHGDDEVMAMMMMVKMMMRTRLLFLMLKR